jgi:hypothetical protein
MTDNSMTLTGRTTLKAGSRVWLLTDRRTVTTAKLTKDVTVRMGWITTHDFSQGAPIRETWTVYHPTECPTVTFLPAEFSPVLHHWTIKN